MVEALDFIQDFKLFGGKAEIINDFSKELTSVCDCSDCGCDCSDCGCDCSDCSDC